MQVTNEIPSSLIATRSKAIELHASGCLASPTMPTATRIAQSLFDEVVAARNLIRKGVDCTSTMDVIDEVAGLLHRNLGEQVISRVAQLRRIAARN